MTKAIDHNSGQLVLTFQSHFRIHTAIHSEGFLCKCSQIKVLERFLTLAIILQDLRILHLINTIMLDDSSRCIVSNQIIVLVIPGQCPWADNIKSTILLQFQFFSDRPLCIMEFNLLVLIDCCMNVVYVVIYSLILCLRTVYDENIFGEHICVRFTAELL